MSRLIDLSIVEAIKLLKKREVSSVELAEAHIARIKEKSSLNAFIEVTEEKALEQAKACDARIKSGNAHPLDGIPIGVKDLFCTKGIRTTAASHILHNFIPEYESTITQKLFDGGAVCLGKTNMDQFAMGSANVTSYFGNVISPWKRQTGDTALDIAQIVPGGSSGGSAAAVASGMCMAAIGSDTGGSIRQPAAFSGIVGIKPSYGRCSRWGIIAFSSSLDQAGVLAKSVADSAIVLQQMCGHDPKESTSANLPVPDFLAATKRGVKGLRVGIPKEYKMDDMNSELISLWRQGEEWLKDAGAVIVPISLPHTPYALPVYYIIAPAEASSNLARYDGIRYGLRVARQGQNLSDMISETRATGFGAEVKRRIMIGTYVLSSGAYDADYTRAQRVRRLISDDFKLAFNDIDVILVPTAPSTAFAIGEKNDDPIIMYLNDVFTVPASLAGLPGISVPVGVSSKDGLPFGLQLIGRLYDEETAFAAASIVEKASGFKVQTKG